MCDISGLTSLWHDALKMFFEGDTDVMAPQIVYGDMTLREYIDTMFLALNPERYSMTIIAPTRIFMPVKYICACHMSDDIYNITFEPFRAEGYDLPDKNVMDVPEFAVFEVSSSFQSVFGKPRMQLTFYERAFL